MLAKDQILDGKYRILSEIGHGGMSTVYLAINDKVNKTWAIKEMRTSGSDMDEIAQKNLIAEIETLRNVKHSKLPSIVDILETANTDSFYIVMDYIEGRSLDKILEESGPQAELFVREWAIQLCDVLQYLHTLPVPIIHRDMKPANIMLCPDGDITVIDFGTAKKNEHREEKADNLGTGGYAAPEQYAKDGIITPQTDIYALGMTLYALLTNVNPQRTKVTDTSIRKINPDFSVGMEKIILKCTQKEPENRYQNCAEIIYDLEHIDTPVLKIKRKIGLFATVLLLALGCGISGTVCKLTANSMAEDTYSNNIDKAAKETDLNEKIRLYTDCANIPQKGGEKDAYLGLIRAFRDDMVFTVEESEQLRGLITNHQDELKAKPENYAEVCFETGKLFWYYFEYGDTSNQQMTRAKSAVEWFETVERYDNTNNMAKVYASVGTFFRDIVINITEGTDKGLYRPFYNNLSELMEEIATDETQSEIVRLELLEMAQGALHQYATKFKSDLVTQSELNKLYQQIEEALPTIDIPEDMSGVLATKKEKILSNMNDTKTAIQTAFST